MRSHGWGGKLPANDEEARQRIVDAGRVIVRATATAPTVAEVADALSVSRATVYRYFPSAEVLLLAAASDGLASFLDDIARALAGLSDAAEVVVEGIAFTLEEIERRTEVALVLAPSRVSGSRELTSEVVVELGRNLLESTTVEWPGAGFPTEAELDGLAQFMLRILQSLVLDPGDPALHGADLRHYLRTWVAPAVTAHQPTERAAQRPAGTATTGRQTS